MFVLSFFLFSRIGLTEEDISSGNFYLSTCANTNPKEVSFCTGMVGGLLIGSLITQSMVSANMATTEEKDFLSSVNDEYQRWEMLERINARHRLYCTPNDGIPISQARDIFLKYLKENPQTRNQPLEFLFIKGMQEAFPCR